jgi:hypothetical protein
LKKTELVGSSNALSLHHIKHHTLSSVFTNLKQLHLFNIIPSFNEELVVVELFCIDPAAVVILSVP